MPNVFDGNSDNNTKPIEGRFSIVVARYNETITRKLLDGAVETLKVAGVADDAIDIAWVPGAFELPVIAKRMAAKLPQAVICLGCVIKGETTHDQHINSAVSAQLAAIGVESGVPVLFGVLTCQSLEQAIHRSGGSVGNKGVDCAYAAIEMARLFDSMQDNTPF